MGADFERRTRKDMEGKGWIISKWQNNVDLLTHIDTKYVNSKKGILGKALYDSPRCIAAKQGFYRLTSTGFPDFIAYKLIDKIWNGLVDEEKQKRLIECGHEGVSSFVNNTGTSEHSTEGAPDIIFIECKVNGKLDKIEKIKAKWYLENNYCSKFFIAYKEKEGRKVVVKYKEFKE